MKIKVMLLLVVILMVAFAGTAYADSYDSVTGTLLIDTVWAGTLQARVDAFIAPDTAADVNYLTITAGDVTQVDAAYIDGNMTALQELKVTGVATFASPPQSFFVNDSVIEHIEIPCLITRRGFAFGCDNLLTVILPNVITINRDGMRNNLLLSTITAPNVVYVGIDSITNNSSLVNLSLPSALEFYVGSLRNNNALLNVSLPLAEYFEGAQFRNCDSIVTLSLPSVEYVGDYCIAGNPLLTSVSLPSVVLVGPYAIRNNDSLTSISLPLAEAFGYSALAGNALLETVSLPKATHFADFAMQNNASLVSAYIPLLDTMGDSAFALVTTSVTMELGSTPPTGVSGTTFAAYDPLARDAVVEVPYNQVDDYDAADGIPSDGMWYGWRIVGIGAIAINPLTGDDSIYIPYKQLGTSAILAFAGLMLLIRKMQKA